MNVAHTLAPVQASDLDGNSVRLGTLWEDGPAPQASPGDPGEDPWRSFVESRSEAKQLPEEAQA